MSVVVDLGCYDDTDVFSSINELVDAFHPDNLIGWDIRSESRDYEIGKTKVQEYRVAAWTHTGWIEAEMDGTGTRLGSGAKVPCADFSEWVQKHGPVEVVKMDIEGSEYEVLRKMHDEKTDALIGLLIIEWHGEKLSGLRCPIVPWWN